MRKIISVIVCVAVMTPNLYAASLTKKQRWMMRIAAVGLVGMGLYASSQEQNANTQASDAINNFNASHSNPGAANYANDQFSALAQQSVDQRNANAWDIGKTASWSAAGLLMTASFIPNTWFKPAENGTGGEIGHQWKFGLPHRKPLQD